MEVNPFEPIQVMPTQSNGSTKRSTTDWDDLRRIAITENCDANRLAQVAELLGTTFVDSGRTFRPLLTDQFLALEAARRACAISPGDQTCWIAAVLCRNLQRHVDAEVYCRLRLSHATDDWEAHAMLGDVLIELGRAEEALDSLDQALRLRPTSGRCRMARIRAAKDLDFGHELESISSLLETSNLPNEDSVSLLACRGHLHEKAGNFAEAFEAYAESNGRKIKPPAEDIPGRFQKIRELYTKRRFDFLQHAGSESEQPIFIVGMPRSGTTLLEQMLSRSSEVYPAGELEDIGIHAARLAKLAEKGDRLLFESMRLTARHHVNQLSRLSGFSARVIDKMPTNFQYLGLIKSLFPKSSVIWIRRDWRDVCVSCFTSNLAHPFASLAPCREYIRHYQAMMEYWIDDLGIDVCEVHYEDFVASPEVTLKDISKYIGIGSMISDAASSQEAYVTRTPSRFQVRRPITTSSVSRWQRFAEYAGTDLDGESP